MNQRTQKIRDWMDSVIQANSFRIGTMYPNDLVLDTEVLRALCDSSAQIAWCVGDSHTHLAVLGIHPKENEMVHCYAQLNFNDKLFKISLCGVEDFKWSELKPEQFERLEDTPIPYSKQLFVGNTGFDLFKNGDRIARVDLEIKGDFENRIYYATITPNRELSGIDEYATRTWTAKEIQSIARSLFVKSEVFFAPIEGTTTNRQNSPSATRIPSLF